MRWLVVPQFTGYLKLKDLRRGILGCTFFLITFLFLKNFEIQFLFLYT